MNITRRLAHTAKWVTKRVPSVAVLPSGDANPFADEVSQTEKESCKVATFAYFGDSQLFRDAGVHTGTLGWNMIFDCRGSEIVITDEFHDVTFKNGSLVIPHPVIVTDIFTLQNVRGRLQGYHMIVNRLE